MIDWKLVVRELVQFHEEFGAACVTLAGEVPDLFNAEITPIVPDNELYASDDELVPKRVRGWLWSHRKAPWFPDDTSQDRVVLFSTIIEGAHVVGMGVLELPENEP